MPIDKIRTGKLLPNHHMYRYFYIAIGTVYIHFFNTRAIKEGKNVKPTAVSRGPWYSTQHQQKINRGELNLTLSHGLHIGDQYTIGYVSLGHVFHELGSPYEHTVLINPQE
jgi:hypothetical protein